MWRLQGFLYKESCHLHRMTVLPLSFQFGYHLFTFLICLLWLELPILCWIEVMRAGILALFLNSAGKFSACHHWVLYWLWVCQKWLLLCWDMFPLYSLCWDFFKNNFIYLFLAVLDLCCYAGFSPVVASRGYCLLQCMGFSSVAVICGLGSSGSQVLEDRLNSCVAWS